MQVLNRSNESSFMSRCMFWNVDCVRVRVPDRDQGLMINPDQLGHELLWRRGSAEARLRLPQSDTELVLFVDTTNSEEGTHEVDRPEGLVRTDADRNAVE